MLHSKLHLHAMMGLLPSEAGFGYIGDMKLIIASDIHGSAPQTEKLLDVFQKSGAEKLVLLGDILYHGPRNDLPEGYNPKKVISLLNPMRNRILSVRGNCEAEVDQMVLEFPVLADYAVLVVDGLTIYLTHGHRYNAEHMLPMGKGELLLHGHTHIPGIWHVGEHAILNPGSISIPKGGFKPSYMRYEDRRFSIRTFEGEELFSYQA